MRPIATFITLTLIGCLHTAYADDIALLPEPAAVKVESDNFTLDTHTIIAAPATLANEAKYLASFLTTSSGVSPSINATTGEQKNIITLQLDPAKTDLGDEGYTLQVTADKITITAPKPAGVFYGIQTLRQLLHAAAIPSVEITDKPRFAWRGFMLDVSRHFFDKHEVESLLDQMAQLKMNVFHWHLTDDNGWRIEIKKYPKLTSIGAWHPITAMEKDNLHIKDGLYGGFYTQDDIREVVAYAADRHILIVPEVDIPGHCSAAMTAYPELAPDNGWKPVIAVGDKSSTERCGAMCVGKENTINFCKDIIDELTGLFPGKYIHIGGDEVFYEQWQPDAFSQAAMKKFGCKDMADLQIHFTNEMIDYVESKGRTAIIWNNLYRQTVDKRGINQIWRDMNPARDFANAGYTVIVSDSSNYYFDHHPKLEKVYRNDPLKMPKQGLSDDGVKRIPGIEACAWTEKVPTMAVLYSQIYPLLFADAETGWTVVDAKDWESFSKRVEAVQKHKS